MQKLSQGSKVKLNNGVEIPVIGLGLYKVAEGQEVEDTVRLALDAGYRMFDTAKIYKNEEGVGKALSKYGLLREEFFVTTKLWNSDQGYESTMKAIDESLDKLGLKYVDLYLVHWPTASEEVREGVSINKRIDTWRAMEEIYKSGKARAIGVSNYTTEHLEEMKRYANIMPMVNQVEFHPFLYQKKLLEYCKTNNIALEAYKSLVGGRRLEDPTLMRIAVKHNKTVPQILLRWGLEHGCIVIPKSTHETRIKENLNIFDFELSDEDIKEMEMLDENMHIAPDPSRFI